MTLHSADGKYQLKFVRVVQKRLGTNKFVRPKSHTGSKFSKISLGLLCTWWTVVMLLYCHFSLRSQMAQQQTAKFRPASFRHFRSTLRKDSIANYGSIWTHFQRTKLFVLLSVGGATRFANLRRKFSQTQKVSRRLVPNIAYGYNWEFLVFKFFCHAPRPAHWSFEGDIFWTGVVCRGFIGRFWYCLHRFFQHWLPFQFIIGTR